MSKQSAKPLNQQVYERLLSAILNSKLTSSTQLDERVLAREYGISRTPIRSAISQLVSQGLVEYFPYRGNFVRHWTKKEINDLFDVRTALEILAIELAIPKLSNEDLVKIEHILQEVDEAYEAGDLDGFGRADGRFHNFIATLTKNETLIEMLDRISLQVQMVRTLANQDPWVVERTAEERPHILAALKARDASAAKELMRSHIEGVRSAVLDQLSDS